MDSTLVVTLTVEQLITIIEDAVQRKIKEHLPPPPAKLFNGKETASKLKVSRATLINYEKRGIIKSSVFGNVKRYRETDIDAALVTLQQYKYKRA